MDTIRDFVRRAVRAVGMEEPLRSIRERQRRLIHRTGRFLHPFPIHRNEPINPFFIVGSGRCGTTLMRRLLQASPQVHIPPENWTMGNHVVTYRRLRRLMSWRDLVDLHLGRHVLGNHRWFDELPVELRDKLLQLPQEERSLACLLDKIYRYHGRVQGATFER